MLSLLPIAKVVMSSDDLPPDLEEPVLPRGIPRASAVAAAARGVNPLPSNSPTPSLPASLTSASLPAAGSVISSPPVVLANSSGSGISNSSTRDDENEDEDEPETLASQMLSASSAALAARAAKALAEEKAAEKAAASGTFLSGGAMRKGFLLGGSGKKSGSEKAADAATKRGGLDLVIAASGGGGGAGTSPSSKASLKLPEVQAAMASPAFAAKLSDGAWMTPALTQRITSDPQLVAGMQNPRFMEAFTNMQKDPKGTMERARSDPPLSDFLQRFMAALGAHFTELGEKEEVEGGGAAGAKARAEAKAKADAEAKEATIGLAAKESRRLPTKPKATPDIAAAVAALGELPANTPDDVRAVLSNPALVDALNDPQIRSILDECRSDPYALRKYLGDVSVRSKLHVLSKAGLIQLS